MGYTSRTKTRETNIICPSHHQAWPELCQLSISRGGVVIADRRTFTTMACAYVGRRFSDTRACIARSAENPKPIASVKSMSEEIKVLDHGYVRYVDHMGSDTRIVESARVSYQSASKGEEADKKLLFYLYKHRHTSPFEMCKITFNIKMPIFVMRQFVRHRMQNLNEVSARYTELPEEFYIPFQWRRQDVKNKQGSIPEQDWNVPWGPEAGVGAGLTSNQIMADNLTKHCAECYRFYKELIADGVAKEMARFALPVNIYTEIYCTWDLKNLMHFFSLRDDPHAQWEHQEFSRAMKSICVSLFPWTMEAYEKFKWEVKEVEK